MSRTSGEELPNNRESVMLKSVKMPVAGSLLLRILLAAMLVTILGCSSGGGDDEGSNGGGGSPDSGEPPPANADVLRVTSFNAGLLPNFVPLAAERVVPVAQAVAAHDADVLCLQEVWQAADVQTVVGALQRSYPSIYLPPVRQRFASRAPVCSTSDLEPIVSCVLTQCLFGTSGIFECLIGTCHDPLEDLAATNPECAQAITAQTGRSSSEISDIQQELFSSSTPAGLFAFGGSSGLILASKLPLEQVQLIDFFDITTTSRRAAIFATVTKNGVRHRIACTHLQSNLDGLIPYTGSLGSWAGEQRGQAERMLIGAANYSGSDPQYLAGDFNCSEGNNGTGVVGDLSENCRLFRDAGYGDVAGAQLGCSFCSSNLLNAANSSLAETRDVLLDHVFTQNLIFTGSAAQSVFTERIAVNGAQTNLSDHFGVRVAVPVP